MKSSKRGCLRSVAGGVLLVDIFLNSSTQNTFICFAQNRGHEKF